MHELKLLLVILPIIAAAYYFAKRAIQLRPPLFRLNDYFLAGGRIGPGVTRANALGSNIALANGLWFFVVLGYLDGVLGITAQITWCLSIYLVGSLVPVILQAARKGNTLHGFLGSSYDSQPLRLGCAFVTGTGYLLNFGFEVYISGTIIAGCLGGDERLKWLFVLVLAICSSTYIGMCGFLGNVSQDRKQNILGILTMLIIVVIATITVLANGEPARGHHFTSGVVAGVSLTKYLGIFAYTAIFNMVDVSNWQSVAANKAITEVGFTSKLRRAWTQTAVLALIFPGIIGVYLGSMLRAKSDLSTSQLFPELFSLLLPEAPELLRTVVVGLLLGGFFILALGYAENLLSAAQFTFMVDVFRRKEYDKLVKRSEDDEHLPKDEDRFVRGCQRGTYLTAVVAVAAFLLALWRLGEDQVFNFMFMIFGSAISMFPAVFYATWKFRRGGSCNDGTSRTAALASVIGGYLVAISPLIFPSFAELSPVFTIATASAIFFIIIVMGRKNQVAGVT